MSGTSPPLSPPLSLFVQDFLDEWDEAQYWVTDFSLDHGSSDPASANTRLDYLRGSARQELDSVKATVLNTPFGPAQDEGARKGIAQAWRIVGRYRELVDQLDRQPFRVGARTDGAYVTDVDIETRGTVIPDDSARLKVEIDGAVNVIQAVFAERRRARPIFTTEATWNRVILKAQDGYLAEIVQIAKVGLQNIEPSRTTFARLDLLRLRNLFTLKEAGIVKNSYVGRLAFWSAIATILFFGLYLLARTSNLCGPASGGDFCRLFVDFRNFYLLAAGTAIGTWLSFSLRRQELAFADLAVLEPDRLNPSARIVFMIGLSCLVGLLLFSGAIVAGVGQVDGFHATHVHGSWALLLGLLAGVAERALGTAVTQRSLDFAAVIGGAQPSTKATV